MYRFILGLFFLTSALSLEAATPVSGYPWVNGEKLTYLIHWGSLKAAEGTFTAMDKKDHWEFKLALESLGMVRTIYPMESYFWSIEAKSPWRSLEYGEERNEPNKKISERTRINYGKNEGVRERWNLGKEEKFNTTGTNTDDIGSMLYSFRMGTWNVNDKRPITVYESSNMKAGEVTCQAIEVKKFSNWPEQRLIRLYAEPVGDEKKKGNITVWLTDDDKRLPVHANLVFHYGTFRVDLMGVSK